MSVPRSNLIPYEISFLTGQSPVAARMIYGLGLAPYAYIRILSFHPFDKSFIIIFLAGPHAVLNVPVEDLQILSTCIGSNQRKESRKHHDDKSFHISSS